MTLRSVGFSGILLPVLCVQGWCVALGTLGAPWRVVHMEGADLGYGGVHIAGHAHWAEVGGGIICVTLGSSLVCTKVCLI